MSMTQTVTPAVSGKRNHYFAVWAFLAGSYIGSILSLLLSLILVRVLYELNEGAANTLVLTMIAAAIAHDAGVHVPLPFRKGQVPEWLRGMLSDRGVAFVFGGLLGFGFLTFLTSSAHVALLLVVGASSKLGGLLVVAAFFSIGKAIPIFAAAGADSLEEVNALYANPAFVRRYVRLLASICSVMAVVLVTRAT
jgi:hypothetical protein